MLGLLVGFALSKAGPALTWQECTKAGCTPHTASVVSDWKDGVQGSIDFDALDYDKDIGVTSSGGSLSQRLVSKSTGKKVIGSRLYLLIRRARSISSSSSSGRSSLTMLTSPRSAAP
jgi:hypothetical protein